MRTELNKQETHIQPPKTSWHCENRTQSSHKNLFSSLFKSIRKTHHNNNNRSKPESTLRIPKALFALPTMIFLAILPFLSIANAMTPVYKADITALSSSGVTGTAVVFSNNDGVVGYAGFATGLGTDLNAADCTAKNGCGAHIHNGKSCDDSVAQGGHYFESPVVVDPWIDERYTTDASGLGTFSGAAVDIGTTDLTGRAFLIHDETGARVGCGLLRPVEESELLVGVTDDTSVLAPIDSSGVYGSVTTYQPDIDHVCYYGSSSGLSASVSSTVRGGSDCGNANGCGAHIHSGTSCTDSTSQGGHFYSTAEDPWKLEGYTSTNDGGMGHYVGCVVTGETSFAKRAFVVHEEDGSRAACGLLESCEKFRACETFWGAAGTWMTRGTLTFPFLEQGLCVSHCIPSWFSAFADFFGYSCGRCAV